jgi:carbonic anhydrase
VLLQAPLKIYFARPPISEDCMTATAQAIIDDLINGNRRFLNGQSIKSSELSIKKLKDFAARGQEPKAIVLCCSDARAPVEIIFDQDIGDLFVIRVAGNIIASSLVGSVEFAAKMFDIPLVMVMGHTQCGAVGATLDHIDHAEAMATENLQDIVSRIKPHIIQVAKTSGLSHAERHNRAVTANVAASVDQLSHSSRLIEDMIQSGKMTIVGAVLDLSTGQVTLLQP